MKKTAAVFLLLLVCMLSCMFPLRYGLKQAAKAVMHHRMQQGREEAYVLIAASNMQAAEWEHDDEFRLGGQMYDVDGVEYRDGLKYYRCIVDGLETRLEDHADNISNNALGPRLPDAQRSLTQALSDWLHGLYFETITQPTNHVPTISGNVFFTMNAAMATEPYLLRRLIPPEA